MADPKTREQNLQLARIDIQSLLMGEHPRLINEWQDAPQFWDAIRFDVDHAESGTGRFLLTGSSVVPEKMRTQISHTGTGRIARLRMRPMSLWESGESSGEVRLGDLFASHDFVSARADSHSLSDMAYFVCRGGWPTAVEQGGDIALDRANDYFEAVVESDISRVDDIPRDPDRVRRLMRSYARLQGTQASMAAMRKDMVANDVQGIDEETIHAYLQALRKIFVVEDMAAWSPSLRARESIRTTDTRYFADPSIAAAALGATPEGLVSDLRTFGFFFEALAIRDLRVYMDTLSGSVEHYRDKTGLECDAVLNLRTGAYALVEVKLGGEALIAEGVASLAKLSSLIASKGMPGPSFRMVVTAVGDFAYRRPEDGVIICPLSALRS